MQLDLTQARGLVGDGERVANHHRGAARVQGLQGVGHRTGDFTILGPQPGVMVDVANAVRLGTSIVVLQRAE